MPLARGRIAQGRRGARARGHYHVVHLRKCRSRHQVCEPTLAPPRGQKLTEVRRGALIVGNRPSSQRPRASRPHPAIGRSRFGVAARAIVDVQWRIDRSAEAGDRGTPECGTQGGCASAFVIIPISRCSCAAHMPLARR